MAKEEVVLSGGPRGGEIYAVDAAPGTKFETEDGHVYRRESDDAELATYCGTGEKFVAPKPVSRVALARAAAEEAARAEEIARAELAAREAKNAASQA
jgi:hypothetical protein